MSVFRSKDIFDLIISQLDLSELPALRLVSSLWQRRIDILPRYQQWKEISQTKENPFILSCHRGYLTMVLYWWPTESLDIKDWYYLFTDVCRNGKLEVAQLIWQRSPLTLANLDGRFYITAGSSSAIGDNVHVLKWLWTLDPTKDYQLLNSSLFRGACAYSRIDKAEWLLSIEPTIDLQAISEEIIDVICYCGRDYMIKWIHARFPENKYIHYRLKHSQMHPDQYRRWRKE